MRFTDNIERTNYRAHETLFEYRLQALNGLWRARKTAQRILQEVSPERSKRALKDEGKALEASNQASSITSELTLLMLIPLLESQSRQDKVLKDQVTQLLQAFFANCTPMSLKGPHGQLDKVQELLMKWLQEEGSCRDAVAKCLVSLACARDSVACLIDVIDVTMNVDVEHDISNVLKMDFDNQNAKVLDVHYHVCGFHYNTK